MEKIEIGLEQDILGMMMINSDIIAPVSEILTVEDFSAHTHKTIYKTILNMYIENRGQPIEIILLINNLASKLSQTPQEIKATVKKYMESVASTLNYKSVAEKIKDYSISRQVREHCHEVVLSVNADNARETAIQTSEKLSKLLSNDTEQTIISVADMVVDYHNRLFQRKNKKNYLRTGFENLDKIILPNKTNVTIIAGRPKTGKTAFALNIMLSQMKQDKRVCFFSLEMDKENELMDRLYSIKSGVLYNDIQTGNVDKYSVQIAQCSEYFSQAAKNFYICDKGKMTTQEIKLWAMTKQADVIVIDYLQLITPINPTKSRENDVSAISRELKLIAKELNVWVICLAQLNRDVEKRANGKPILADLRESGAIEQDANQIIFLYAQNIEDTKSQDITTIVVDVAKNRNGAEGSCLMTFDKPHQRFLAIDGRYVEDKPYIKKDEELVPNEY